MGVCCVCKCVCGLWDCLGVHTCTIVVELVNLIHSTHTQEFSHNRKHLGLNVARDVEEQVMCVCVNGRRTVRQDFTGVSSGRHIAVKVFPLRGCVCLCGALSQPDG